MKIKYLIDEIKTKNFFQQFMKENPDAFFVAGFFVLDDTGGDKYQLDYYLPSKKKIATTEFPFSEIKIHDDHIERAERLKIAQVDICDLRVKVEEIKTSKSISLRTNKIIALLKDDVWQLTCLSDGVDIVKIHIDSVSGEVKRCEKINLFQIMNRNKVVDKN